MSKSKSVEAVEAKRQAEGAHSELRAAILMNAIEHTKNQVRRDSQLVSYVRAAVQTLREIEHPLALRMMDDLAFNLTSKAAFSQACNMLGLDIPPAVEVTQRKTRNRLTASEEAILNGEREQAEMDARRAAAGASVA